MFAIVRTGGKQYRVAAGDKIAVEKIDGEAGDTVSLGDVLLAGDGGEVKSADGLVVSAEIIAQTRGEKVIVFKKRRRHNYRRRNGHRQSLTLLRILAVGEAKKAAPKKEAAPKAEAAPATEAKAARPPRKLHRRRKLRPRRLLLRSRKPLPRRPPPPRSPLPRRQPPRRTPERGNAARPLKRIKEHQSWHIRKQAVHRATVATQPAAALA